MRVWSNQSVGVLAACINLLEPRLLPLSRPLQWLLAPFGRKLANDLRRAPQFTQISPAMDLISPKDHPRNLVRACISADVMTLIISSILLFFFFFFFCFWEILCLMWTRNKEGLEWLSTATSPSESCEPLSYSCHDRVVNSAAQRKPKKPIQQAALSIRASLWLDASHTANILRRIKGVMGRRCRDWQLDSACRRFTPFKTYSSFGHDELLNGSGMLSAIWAWRIPER